MQLFLLALACLGAAELGQLASEPGASLPLPGYWPSTGILLALLLVSERRRWPLLLVVAVGAVWLSLSLHGWPLSAGVGAAMLTGVDAGVAAVLVRRLAGGDVALDRLTHTLALVAVAIGVPMLGGVAAAWLIIPEAPGLVSPWFAWWLAESAGMLVAAPLVLIGLDARRMAVGLGRWNTLEVIVVIAAALLVGAGIFGGGMPTPLRVPAFILPFLLWPAIRFGVGPASVTVFAVAFLVLRLAPEGQLPLAMMGDGNVLMRAQGGIIVAASSVLLLGSVVSERKRVAAERDELVARLQHALAEIKTLRGLIPICAWCHKVRDDAGFWKEIEHYLDEHTDATFSHGICPLCIAEHESDIAEHEAASRTRVI